MVTMPAAPAFAVKLNNGTEDPISPLVLIVPRVDCNPKVRILLMFTLSIVPVMVIPPPTFIWVFCATIRSPPNTAPEEPAVVRVIAALDPKVTSTAPFWVIPAALVMLPVRVTVSEGELFKVRPPAELKLTGPRAMLEELLIWVTVALAAVRTLVVV